MNNLIDRGPPYIPNSSDLRNLSTPDFSGRFSLIAKERIVERRVAKEELCNVLLDSKVQRELSLLQKSGRGLAKFLREARLVNALSNRKAGKLGLLEKKFTVYASVVDTRIFVTQVGEGESPYSTRRISSSSIADIPPDVEAMFVLYTAHSESDAKKSDIIQPSAYSKLSGPGDLMTLSNLTNLYRSEGLAIRPIMILVRPAAQKALFVQEKKGVKRVEKKQLEQFESTYFKRQTQVKKALSKLGYNAFLVDLPLNNRTKLVGLLNSFEFQLEAKILNNWTETTHLEKN